MHAGRDRRRGQVRRLGPSFLTSMSGQVRLQRNYILSRLTGRTAGFALGELHFRTPFCLRARPMIDGLGHKWRPTNRAAARNARRLTYRRTPSELQTGMTELRYRRTYVSTDFCTRQTGMTDFIRVALGAAPRVETARRPHNTAKSTAYDACRRHNQGRGARLRGTDTFYNPSWRTRRCRHMSS